LIQLQNLSQSFDVLVVGAGAAGLYTALCLPETYSVGLITKDTISLSASDWAQGGIAAAMSPEDSPSLHVEDTIAAGAGLCNVEAVNFLAQKAPSCIQSLVGMGVAFDRQGEQLALTLEAAHSRRRVLHAADTTGKEVITTLTAQVLQRKNISILQQTLVLSLWLDSPKSRCQGISLIYEHRVIWLRAKAVVLATGGGGQVFAHTTNPAVSTGDGVAMSWRSGAVLRDLEFVQFHPTALTIPGANSFLISEAVRGEGAHLVDDLGRRFAFDYHPKGELASRDVVSRAIFTHLQNTAIDPTKANVWLDLRSIPADKIRHRFPNIIQACKRWGLDVFSEPIPVAPAAHYWMGGIVTDLMNRTSLPGLYAVGETASTGVHGANRLASNSLLECIVFGAQMANLELEDVDFGEQPSTESVFKLSTTDWNSQQEILAKLRKQLPRLVWQSAGICREQKSLETGIEQLEIWRSQFAELPLSKFLFNLPTAQIGSFDKETPHKQLFLWGETRNLLDIAYLILASALFRTESRGGHYRQDYLQTEKEWQVHTLVEKAKVWRSALLGSG
jgi:L-aspartate oxidase